MVGSASPILPPTRLHHTMNNFWKTVVVTALLLALVGLVLPKTATQTVSSLGATIYNRVIDFSEGISVDGTTIIDGSGNFTVAGTSTFTGKVRAQVVRTGSVTSVASGSVHYTAAQFCNSSVIRHNVHFVAGQGAIVSSASNDVMPTAASLIADCVPTAGDMQQFVLQNTSDDALERITLVPNTGIDLFLASGSAATEGSKKTLDRKDTMLLRFWNVDGASVSFSLIKVEDTN